MLTGALTLRHPIPNEEGNWLELRLLGWKALEDARQVRQLAALKSVAALGLETVKQLQSASASQTTETDPLDGYDRRTLLVAGIAAWSYPEPVTPEAIDRLDEPTAKWAAETILVPQQKSEEQRLNGFLPSTTSSAAIAAPLPAPGF